MNVSTSTRNDPVPSAFPASEMVFRFLSGRLCLAFVATVGERWRRNFERLVDPEDLARWVVEAGLLEVQPSATATDLRHARELREAIYRLVRAGMDSDPFTPADCELVNSWARRPCLAPQIGPSGALDHTGGARPMPACLATVARDAVELVTGSEMTRVRECASDECALLFVDRSRPGKRRWCADGACATRHRSAEYRRRQQ